MSAKKLVVSAALSENIRTRPLLSGRVAPEGIDLVSTAVHPSEMFWRQLKFQEFDVSEMSLSSLLIAHSQGNRDWVALPVYTMRRFFHTGILVRKESGISTPADLRGKRVGVPEYQQTAAIWVRGILEDEFDVRARDIEWFMERGPGISHGGATGFRPPEGVRLNQISPDTNIGKMMAEGALDATILYLREPNLVDRSVIDLDGRQDIAKLFADPTAEAHRYFAKTGIYPINHAVVVRRSLVEQHPWIALNLYNAFCKAREVGHDDANAVISSFKEVGSPLGRISLDDDPIRYGYLATSKIVETVSDYVHRQGLTVQKVDPRELFAPATLGL